MSGEFMVFAGSCFYPMGGWADYKGTFETFDEALSVDVRALTDANEVRCDWGQIVYDGRIIAEYGAPIVEPDANGWEVYELPPGVPLQGTMGDFTIVVNASGVMSFGDEPV